MADTVITLPPLTDAQKAERFGHTTKIQVSTHSLKWTIGTEWKSLGTGSSGYVQMYQHVPLEKGNLELEVPQVLDIARLAVVILGEIERQRVDKS